MFLEVCPHTLHINPSNALHSYTTKISHLQSHVHISVIMLLVIFNTKAKNANAESRWAFISVYVTISSVNQVVSGKFWNLVSFLFYLILGFLWQGTEQTKEKSLETISMISVQSWLKCSSSYAVYHDNTGSFTTKKMFSYFLKNRALIFTRSTQNDVYHVGMASIRFGLWKKASIVYCSCIKYAHRKTWV